MKILFLAHVSTVLGANRSLINLIDGLENKYDCTVILPENGPIIEELKVLGVKYKVIPFKHSSVKFRGKLISKVLIPIRCVKIGFTNLLALIRLNSYIKKNGFQIIHSNSGAISIGYFLSKVSKVSHVWHLREFQDLDYNIEHWLGKNFMRGLLKRSPNLIAISQSVATHFLPARCTVIYNGLHRELLSRESIKKGYRFIFCGALIPSKGLVDAVEAIAKLSTHNSEVKLLIAGEFQDHHFQAEVIDLIKSLGINENVEFLGFVKNVSSYMSESIALLMCSKNEGFGRVTIEAMLNRCVVIGFNNAGTQELVKHGETGYLYNTVDELVDMMTSLIKHPNERIVIEEKARVYASDTFSVKKYASQIQNIYKIATDA